MAGDTENVWQDIELRIDSDPFCTPCQMYSMNKKARSKNPLKPKASFKWIFMNIIPETYPKRLTNEMTFSNYLLIVDSYYNPPNFILRKELLLSKLWISQICSRLDMEK